MMVRRKKQTTLGISVSGSSSKYRFTKLGTIFLLFVVMFVLFSIGVFAEVEGCYLFAGGSEDYLCQDNVLESDAEADCLEDEDCDFDSMFISGASCSDYPEVCEEVTCSFDCDTHSMGKCEDLGGAEIEDDEYDNWCSEGCCSVGSFCEYVDIKYDCVERAIQQGYDQNDILMIIDDMDSSSCQTDICGVELSSGTIGGYVLDEEGLAIEGATLELSSTLTDISASDGYFFFSSVTPGSYVLRVSATDYSSSSTSVSVSSGGVVEVNVTLGAAGDSYTLSGTVYDDTSAVVNDVSICFESTAGDETCTSSSSDGSYSVSGLQADDYNIALTKYGYSSTTDSLTVSGDDFSTDLIISSIDFQGVSGITWLDENGDNQVMSPEGEMFGVSIYVDGVYKTNSQYPDGDYSVYLADGDYVIQATYQDYASEEYEITVAANKVDLVILLQQEIGECSYGEENQDKPVEYLDATVTQGETEVILSWEKPCNEVSGYIIEKDGETFGDSYSPLAISITDRDVEWGETYTYSIWAVYTDGPLDETTDQPQVRLSTSAAEVTVTIGNLNCENREVGSTFCVVDDSDTTSDERKYVYSCDENNNIITSIDCTRLDSSDSSYFCSAASDTYALCKDAGSCSILGQAAEPFGLYYDSTTCYGNYDTEDGYESFCYYDYTETSIVDACYSCEEVVDCFDYISQESCQLNNCLGIGCSWIDSSNSTLDYGIEDTDSFLDFGYLFPTTEQTGHGYCVEDNYGELELTGYDDYCSLCGPDADLFENTFCTADVCSNLGRCFADEELTVCDACGDVASSDANCYTYTSALECSGGNDISITSGEVSGSEDSCTWSACAWQESSSTSEDEGSVGEGVNGYCYKDGDANRIDDCSEFSSGEYTSCVKDVYPPTTSIVTESFQVVSTAYPNVTFSGVDSDNPMGQVGYCMMSSDASDCDDFEYVDYDGLENSEELLVDLVNSSFLTSSEIDGESYILRYFSLDKYYNQESVREAIVFVDNHLPEFTVEWESTTDADLSELLVYLSDMNEAMSCEFILDETYPAGDSFDSSSDREEDKEATFSDLDGIIYNLTVNCYDDYGNLGAYDEEIVFDLEQDITLIYPEYNGAVAETSIEFAITTAVSASCELYDVESGLKLADFASTDIENKEHQTEEVSGFYEGDYAGTTKVVCVESLDGGILEDYFYFSVDFTAPETQIILSEGERVEEPTGYDWEEYFIEEVQIDFECIEDDGFACASTYYCLGDECEYAEAEGYVEYTASSTITESTQICYYSIDEGGSVAYPDCGEILIEGFGIILVTPTQFYYEDEVWGVSNSATFDWDIMTKIDTNVCAFDFNSGFDMASSPVYKQISESDTKDNYYTYSDFPGDVLEAFDESGSVKKLYVQCEDYLGEVGPAQLMNLEYDPSAPVIESNYADPDSMSEGVETYLFVSTDDKTLCKFSDDSDLEGSSEYDTMEYSFPGFELEDGTQELFLDHDTAFGFSFAGAAKDYLLNVQCMNGAGDLSETEEIAFNVDYSVSGYIASISPDGYISETDITLEIVTSKNAECSYDETVMETTGGTSHSQYLGVFEEGEYQYLIVCSIEGSDREAEANFIIDLTAPTITEIDDGSYSCSLDTTPALTVVTDDQEISSYYYELYQGESVVVEDSSSDSGDNETDSDTSTDSSSDSTSSGAGTLITSGTMPAVDGSQITGLTLIENTTYYFEVSATDAAGNAGSGATSDGFIAIAGDSEICVTDETAPTITVTTTDSCTGVSAELDCEDTVGCATVLYDSAASSSDCEAIEDYYGASIDFESSGWVCYYAEDVNGNNISSSQKITFSDSDGDEIADSCDLCSSTTAGSAVDSEGCGYGEVPDADQTDDQDNDGLPDTWEILYDQTSCPYSYVSSDSDSDGTLDTNEDYDGDGYTSYEEYRAGYDPCTADGPSQDSTSTDDTTTTDDDSSSSSSSSSSDGGSMLALIFFLIGLVLVMGGAGGLYYAYTQDPKGKSAIAQYFGSSQTTNEPYTGVSGGNNYSGPRMSMGGGNSSDQGGEGSVTKNSWISNMRNAVAGLGKVRNNKAKRKDRISEFGDFDQSSSNFPHFADVLESKKKPLEKLGDLSSRYSENRNDIRKGLQPHEKSLFSQLDSISSQAKGKSIADVASASDAKDIFSKLKKLSDKRSKQ